MLTTLSMSPPTLPSPSDTAPFRFPWHISFLLMGGGRGGFRSLEKPVKGWVSSHSSQRTGKCTAECDSPRVQLAPAPSSQGGPGTLDVPQAQNCSEVSLLWSSGPRHLQTFSSFYNQTAAILSTPPPPPLNLHNICPFSAAAEGNHP